MAHFYGTLKGSAGETSRLGTKKSGLQGSVRGWNLGVNVSIYYDEKTGEDVVSVSLTGGSNGQKSSKCLGTFTAKDLE